MRDGVETDRCLMVAEGGVGLVETADPRNRHVRESEVDGKEAQLGAGVASLLVWFKGRFDVQTPVLRQS